MKTVKVARICTGIIGTLLGAACMALALTLIFNIIQRSGGRLNESIWLFPCILGLPLLAGGIGTLFGSRMLTWVLVYTNSIILLWVLMAVGGNVGLLASSRMVRPEGFVLLLSVILELASGVFLLSAENRNVKALVVFVLAMVIIGYATRFISNQQAHEINGQAF